MLALRFRVRKNQGSWCVERRKMFSWHSVFGTGMPTAESAVAGLKGYLNEMYPNHFYEIDEVDGCIQFKVIKGDV